jgi:hypothetical protein
MHYVAIYNQETMEILGTESYEKESDAQERKRQFDLECLARGRKWVPYIGEKEFAFTKSEDSNIMLAAMKRSERNQKLADSDWTQLNDSPVKDLQAWLVYRKALRDITTAPGFPDAIKWPEEPNA